MNDNERRRREFIRAHHPDRGGDTENFIAGLRAFEAEGAPEDPLPTVVVTRRPSWLARLVIVPVRRLLPSGTPPRVR